MGVTYSPITLTEYQKRMSLARSVDADRRYSRGVNAIIHAIYLRKDPYDSVLYHIRGTCKDDCRWCQIG